MRGSNEAMERNGAGGGRARLPLNHRRPSAIAPDLPCSQPACSERHYSIAEIADAWHVSPDAVRKVFREEPGVLVLGGQSHHKRRYTTLRVPESVLQRVHRRMTNI